MPAIHRSMSQSVSESVGIHSVAQVSQLQIWLNYAIDDEHGKRSSQWLELRKVLKNFRTNYKDKSSGRSGLDMIRWENDHDILDRMAEAFLVKERGGANFWPAAQSHSYWNGLVYLNGQHDSNSTKKIHYLVKCLIWRDNCTDHYAKQDQGSSVTQHAYIANQVPNAPVGANKAPIDTTAVDSKEESVVSIAAAALDVALSSLQNTVPSNTNSRSITPMKRKLASQTDNSSDAPAKKPSTYEETFLQECPSHDMPYSFRAPRRSFASCDNEESAEGEDESELAQRFDDFAAAIGSPEKRSSTGSRFSTPPESPNVTISSPIQPIQPTTSCGSKTVESAANQKVTKPIQQPVQPKFMPFPTGVQSQPQPGAPAQFTALTLPHHSSTVLTARLLICEPVKVGEIRENLRLGNKWAEFQKVFDTFRWGYVAKDQRYGTSFISRLGDDSPLREMMHAFLDTLSNGDRFWPSKTKRSGSSLHNQDKSIPLIYRKPDDRCTIQDQVTNLINLRNDNYKRRWPDAPDSTADPRPRLGMPKITLSSPQPAPLSDQPLRHKAQPELVPSVQRVIETPEQTTIVSGPTSPSPVQHVGYVSAPNTSALQPGPIFPAVPVNFIQATPAPPIYPFSSSNASASPFTPHPVPQVSMAPYFQGSTASYVSQSPTPVTLNPVPSPISHFQTFLASQMGQQPIVNASISTSNLITQVPTGPLTQGSSTPVLARPTSTAIVQQPSNIVESKGRRAITTYKLRLLPLQKLIYNWKPNGTLKGKSLSDFIQEIPAMGYDVSRFEVKYKNPLGEYMEEAVTRGREEEWDKAKMNFINFINDSKQAYQGNVLNMAMDITVFCSLPEVQMLRDDGEWTDDL